MYISLFRRGFEAGWGFAVTKTFGLDKVYKHYYFLAIASKII